MAFVIQPNSLDNRLPEEKGARKICNPMRCYEITYNSRYIKCTHFIPTTGEAQPVTALCAGGVSVAVLVAGVLVVGRSFSGIHSREKLVNIWLCAASITQQGLSARALN